MSSSRAPGSSGPAARRARRAGRAPPWPGWPRPCPSGCRRGTGRCPASPRPGAGPAAARPAGERLGEPRVAERLLRQLHQLVALASAHRVEHPLGGGGPGGEQVDQLLGVLRVLREELAVLGHELVELRGGVLARGVVGEQVVEVVEHLPDPLDVLGRRVLHAPASCPGTAGRAAPGRAGRGSARRPRGRRRSASRTRRAPAPPRRCRRAGRRAASRGTGRRRRRRGRARRARPGSPCAAARGPPARVPSSRLSRCSRDRRARSRGSGRRARAARRSRGAAAPAAPCGARSPP